MGAVRFQKLVVEKFGEDTIKLLLAGAAGLPVDDLEKVGAVTYDAFPSAWSQPIWDTFTTRIEMARIHRIERRQPALAALWTFTTAATDVDTPRALAKLLKPGELQSVASDPRGPRNRQRIGAVASALLVLSTDEWADEVSQTAAVLGEEYLVGLGPHTPTDVTIPNALLAHVMTSAPAQRAFVSAGFGDQLTAWVSTPAEAQALLTAAHKELNDDQVHHLLTRADWTALGSQPYDDLCQLLSTRLSVLTQQLRRAIESLTGPEATASPPETLATLLDLALDADLRREFGDDSDITTAVLRLLDHPASNVVESACAWIRILDLGTGHECDHQRVQGVIKADNDRGRTFTPLVALRSDLATRLNQLTLDTTLRASDRNAHLQMAAEVDPTTARQSALALGGTQNNDLRGKAAQLLATTPGRSEDLELLAVEPRQDIRRNLESAKHRISSGTIGEAVHALADLLDTEPDPNRLDPQVLIPHPQFNDRFVTWVDRARARADNQADPGSFIEAVINLADLMVDIVLIAATEAGARTNLDVETVQAIRDNNNRRPDIGNLLVRQNYQPLFGWFPLCTALRRKRTAHPSPLGSTQPHSLGPDDLITAKSLFRDIAEGWITDMYRYQ